MKLLNLILITLLMLLVSLPSAQAQWVQCAGPYGGDVSCFAVSGKKLFAGTVGGGVFVSADNGSTWHTTGTLANTAVHSLLVNGTSIFAGTDKGVQLSIDSGATWNVSGLTSLSVFALTAIGSNIFAGTSNVVYLSTNNGTSWAAAGTGIIAATRVNALASSGTTVAAGTEKGFYLSSNSGTQWITANSGLPVNASVLSIAFDGIRLFIGTRGGVFISSNSGTTWTKINSEEMTDATSVNALAISGQTVFAGTSTGTVLRTSNDGTSWANVYSGITGTYVSSLIVSGTNILQGNKEGISYSSNLGINWADGNSGLTALVANVIDVDGEQILMGSDNAVFKSTDEGDSWSMSRTGLEGIQNFGCFASIGTNRFTGSALSGIYRSADNGTSWVNVNSTLLGVSCLAVVGTDLFAGAFPGGLSHTTNLGTQWSAVSGGFSGFIVTTLASSGANVYAISEQGMFRSMDGGTNWLPINSSFINSQTQPVAYADANIVCVGNDKGAFVSIDNGTTWSSANADFNSEIVSSVYSKNSILYAGTGTNKVFVSASKGVTWTDVSTGLPSGTCNWLRSNDKYIFAASSRGVFKRPLSELGVSDVGTTANGELMFVSPNPATEIITLQGIPENCRQIRVLNVLGKQVLLIDNHSGAVAHLNVSDFAPGSYYIQCLSGGSMITRLIVID